MKVISASRKTSQQLKSRTPARSSKDSKHNKHITKKCQTTIPSKEEKVPSTLAMTRPTTDPKIKYSQTKTWGKHRRMHGESDCFLFDLYHDFKLNTSWLSAIRFISLMSSSSPISIILLSKGVFPKNRSQYIFCNFMGHFPSAAG